MMKNMSLKEEKKQINPGKSPKPELISYICNLLNHRPGVNQEPQFNIQWWNKKVNLKNFSRLKNHNQNNRDKTWYVNIMKEDEIVKNKN